MKWKLKITDRHILKNLKPNAEDHCIAEAINEQKAREYAAYNFPIRERVKAGTLVEHCDGGSVWLNSNESNCEAL